MWMPVVENSYLLLVAGAYFSGREFIEILGCRVVLSRQLLYLCFEELLLNQWQSLPLKYIFGITSNAILLCSSNYPSVRVSCIFPAVYF